METLQLLLSSLMMRCLLNSRFCDAKQAENLQRACDKGKFHYTHLEKCLPCKFTCKIGEEVCRHHDCLDFMQKQCKQEECYEGSIGRCSNSNSAKCLPFAPSHLKVFNLTAVAATVEWISEFDGNAEQTFYVQYKKLADNWDVASEVPQGGIADTGQKKTVRYKVTGLKSNVTYVFRVLSNNSHPGSPKSDFSNMAYGTTPDSPLSTSETPDSTTSATSSRFTSTDISLIIIVCLLGCIVLYIIICFEGNEGGTFQPLPPDQRDNGDACPSQDALERGNDDQQEGRGPPDEPAPFNDGDSDHAQPALGNGYRPDGDNQNEVQPDEQQSLIDHVQNDRGHNQHAGGGMDWQKLNLLCIPKVYKT
ncbi:uncharacterized protein LOC135502489 isoform X2 [Lineus longissimus]|uniref:uncharacterized protein LOC135502489 isoform X2 n=1 Tax=Lineus longissimus TaxID=88925 RepID=UPI00315CF85F